MIVKIAWKNIWRNPLRSATVIVAVMLGIWAGVFMIAFINGLAEQRLDDQLSNTIAHVKISNPKFTDEKLPQYFVPESKEIIQKIKSHSQVKAISPRVNMFGMAQSSKASYGVDIYGVDPKQEKATFGLYRDLVEGQYLEGIKRNPIVIGKKLAKRLSLKLRSKIIITFQDLEGNLVAGAFRVTGIYQITNTAYEGSHVFVKAEDLQKLLGQEEAIVHQIAISTPNYENAQALADNLKGKFAGAEVESWQEVAPELAYIDEVMSGFFLIFMGIILLGLSLGIVNTMLMAVLERSRELGMLMAVGMSKPRVFLMIMLETFFLTSVGLPLGLGLAWLSVYFAAINGIDLSAVGEGFAALGYSTLIRPSLSVREYFQTTVLVFLAAFLSAIYPSLKALKLRPAEAIRE